MGLLCPFFSGVFSWMACDVSGRLALPLPGAGVTFLCLAKEKSPKERRLSAPAYAGMLARDGTAPNVSHRNGTRSGSRRFRAIAPPGGAVYRPLAPSSLRSDDGHIRAGGVLGFEYLSGDRRTCATRDVRDMKAWFAASRALKLARSANGAPFAVRPRTRLSFGYFSLARQRKVTPAPGRGDANRPLTSQAVHDKPRTTDKRRRPRQKRAKEPRPINPVAIAQDASRAVA
ncbi:putative liporotein [Burkholderia pseudomallei]|nr:putative liporotein [Burkholderia pseudomallei MSHR840]KGC37954.1 putative liporotein [Burkholderia pseudomallei]